MRTPRKRAATMLERLLRAGGGAYRTTGRDGVFFHLYTQVTFTAAHAERRNFSVGLRVAAPPGNSRSSKASTRADFWEHSRRLSNGNLVALVLLNVKDQLCIFLGTIVSTGSDIAESAKASAEQIEVRVSFFDPEVELDSLRGEKVSETEGSKYKFGVLVDNSILFESMRPFLDTLKKIEPTSIPFGSHIVSEENLAHTVIEPPVYARVPNFQFKIKSLFPPGTAGVEYLDAQSPTSIQQARDSLRQHSTLDISQADAVVDALTREVCLIQG